MLRLTNRGNSAVNRLCLCILLIISIQIHNVESATPKTYHFTADYFDGGTNDSIIPYLKYYNSLLHFEENKGEWADSISYILQKPGARVAFIPSAVSFSLFERRDVTQSDDKSFSLSLEEEMDQRRQELASLSSGDNSDRSAEELVGHHYSLTWRNTPGTLQWSTSGTHPKPFNRYKSSGQVHNKAYHKEVWGKDLYPNIDVRFYSLDDGTMEYDYVIHPGGSWDDINFQFSGIENINLSVKGTLILETALGAVDLGAPYTYQVVDGQEVTVASSYVINTDNSMNIVLDTLGIDPELPIIIDPVAVEWSTFYGGGRSDVLADFIQDETGIYALFSTLSFDFPVSPGPFQVNLAGNQDLAVVRLSNNGEQIWSTYIGGSDFESANAIAIDNEAVYIVAESASEDYPTTPGAFQPAKQGFSNLVISKLEKSRGTLEWSSYLGGNAFEFGGNIIMGQSNIFITAFTGSFDYPTSSGAFQEGPVNLGENAVVSAIGKATGNLSWSSYFSASGVSRDAVLFADGLVSGSNLVLTGTSPRGLPASSNAIAPQNNGDLGGIIVEFDRISGELQYASFIQNAGNYTFYQIAENNEQYILYGQSDGGFTNSPTAFQSGFGGGQADLLLVTLDKADKSINWSTFMGGTSIDFNSYSNFKRRSLAVIGDTIFLSGLTSSRNFPTSPNAWQPETAFPVGQKFILSSFDLSSGNNIWSSYFSPEMSNAADDIFLLANEGESLFSVGRTRTDNHFTTPNAFQAIRYGGFDLVAHEINRQNGYPVCGSYIGGEQNEGLRNAFALDGKLLIAGNAISNNFPVTGDAFQTSLPSDQEVGFFTTLSPCCVDVFDNSISPDNQIACKAATPNLLQGEVARSFIGYPEIIRGNAVFAQDGSAKPGQYIWQRSEDGIVWSIIPGARDRSYQPETLVEDQLYRRIFGCDTSNIAIVTVSDDTAPTVEPGGPFVLCPDGSVQIGGNPTVSMANGNYTIQWQPQSLLDDATIDNPTATIDRNAIFEVAVIDDAGCRVVKNTSVYQIEPYVGGDKTICLGDTIRLGNSPLPPNDLITYEWEVISGDLNAIIGNPQSAKPLISPDITTDLRLTTSFGGACVFEDEVTVNVISIPTPDAGEGVTICAGESIILGPADSDTESLSYEWFPKRGLNNFNIPNPEFDGKPSGDCGSVNFVLEVKDTGGICSGKLDSVQIDLIIADAGKDACGPRRIGTPDRSCGRDNYFWEVIEGDASSIAGQENIPQPFVDPNSPTRYRLSVSFDGVTCTSEVFVPGCTCPQIDAEFPVPVNCSTFEQEIPYCIDLPEADGFEVSLLDGDQFVTLDNNQLCLVQPLMGNRTYQIQLEKGFVSCVSTVTFVLDLPELPQIEEDSIYICPANQPTTNIQIGTPPVVGYSYKWRPSLGISDTEAATTTLDWAVLPERQNTYTLEVKHEATGCVFPLQVNIFNRSPLADAGGDRDFCGGIFAVLGSPDRDNYSYSWSPIDGLDDPQASQPELSLFEGPGDYIYSVEVTDPETGCSDTDEVTLRILESISADAGEDLTICLGESVQLGNPNAPTSGYTYRWEPGDGLSNTTSPAPFASPQTTTTYTLVVSLDGTNTCEAIDEVTVTVNESTEINIDAGPDLTVCTPGNYTIGPEPQDGLIYSWSPIIGLDDPTIAMPTITVDSSITYFLTIVNREDCTIGSDSVSIIIDSLPPLAGMDREICRGDSIKIGNPALAGVTYVWSPEIDISDPNIANPTVFPEEDIEYVLSYQQGDCFYSDSIVVVVNDTPVADAGDDQVFCNFGVVIGPKEVVDEWSYTWSPAIGLSGSFDPNPEANPTKEQVYILTVSTPLGCIDIDSVTITPPFKIELDQLTYSTCLGDTIQIGPSFLDDNATYEWQPTDQLFDPSALRPQFIASEVGVFDLSLMVTKGNCMRTFNFVVNVENPGSIELDQNSLNACKNGCVETLANIDGQFTSFYWTPTTGVFNPDRPSTTICPEDDQVYILTGINAFNQCLTRDTLFINVRDVEAPEANAGPDQSTCIGNTIVLGGEQLDNLSYSWTPGSFLSGTTIGNPIFSALVGGQFEYSLQVFDEETFCTAIDQVTVDVVDFTIEINAPDSVCVGQPFSLEASIIENPLELDINEFSFEWVPADVLDDSSIQTPTAIIEESTQFEVRVTHLPSGCQQEIATTVSVNGDAIPDFTFPSDILVCDINEPYQIPFEAEPGFSYSWLPGFRLSATNIVNPIIQTPIPVGGVYQLTIEDTSRTDGCRFFVHRLQIVEADVVQLPDMDYIYCDMSLDSIQIGPEIPSVPDDYTIEWIPFGGLSHTNTEQTTAVADLARVYEMIITRQDNPDRVYASCQTSSQHRLLPQPLPMPRPGNNKGLCEPGSIQIGGPTNPDLTYNWSPTTALNQSNIPRPLATVDQTTRFFLEVTDEFGCKNIDSIDVIISEVVIELVTFQDASCDEDEGGIIEVQAEGGLPPYEYLWSTMDGSGLITDQPNQSDLTSGTYTVTATDAAGCTAMASFIIDEEGECCDTIIFTYVPEDLTINCDAVFPTDIPEAEDHCCDGEIIIEETLLHEPLDCPQNEVFTRLFTVTDACGNISTLTQTITILDNVGPTFDFCPDLSEAIPCSDNNMALIENWHLNNLDLLSYCARDNCSDVVLIDSDFDLSLFEPGCSGSGSITVSYFSQDLCSNAGDTVQFTLTIMDDTPPDLSSCPPLDQTVSCENGDLLQLANSWHANNTVTLMGCAEETCSSMVVLTHNFNTGNINTVGCTSTLEVTYAAMDLCGNISESIIASLTIVDDIPPNISACNLQDEVVDCSTVNFPADAISWHEDNLVTLATCAIDNCDNEIIIDSDFNPNNFSTTCGATGTLQVTYSIADACGNVADPITATWSIEDDNNLDIQSCNLNLDTTIECSVDNIHMIQMWHDANLQAVESCGITACSEGLEVTSDFDIENFTIDCGNAGSLTVNYGLSNGCTSATNILSATIFIEDNTPPDVSSCNLPEQAIFSCNIEENDIINDWHQSNLDLLLNCSIDCDDDLVILTNFEGLNIEVGCGLDNSYTVTYALQDNCGNTSDTIEVELIIEAINSPNISSCSIPSSSINCADGDLEVQATSWHLDNLNYLMSCGNEPCNNIEDVLHDFSFEPMDLNCDSENTIIVNYQLLDACGLLSDTITAILTIEQPPAIDLSSCDLNLSLIAECSGDNMQTAQDWHDQNLLEIMACLSDICMGGFSIEHDFEFGLSNDVCEASDPIVVNYIVINACLDTMASVEAQFSILDSQPPVITWNEPDYGDLQSGDTLFIQCASNVEGWSMPEFGPESVSVSDDCSDDVIVEVSEVISGTGDCLNDGYFYNLRCVWTATDPCDNTDSLVLHILVIDTVPPVIHNVPGDITVACHELPPVPELSNCPDDPEVCCESKVWVTDDCECAELKFEEDVNFENCNAPYTIIRRWSAIDNCGNSSIAEQIITVLPSGETALVPVHDSLIDYPLGSSIHLACSDSGTLPDWILMLDEGAVAAVDVCPGVSYSIAFGLYQIDEDTSCTSGYLEHWMPVWTLQSECGNSVQYFIDVFITDNAPPVISANPEVCGTSQAVIEAIDNCSSVMSSFWDESVPSICVNGGTDIIRHWISEDACGNTSSFDQRIINADGGQEPIIDINNEDLENTSFGDTIEQSCQPHQGGWTNFDSSDISIISVCGQDLEVDFSETLITHGSCNQGFIYEVLVSWTAVDPCYGEVVVTYLVKLIDDQPPLFLEDEIFLTCGEEIRAPNVEDGCTGIDLVIIAEEWDQSADCLEEYRLFRTYLATDECGNTAQQIIEYSIQRQGAEIIFNGLDDDVICHNVPVPEVSVIDPCTGESLNVSFSTETYVDHCLNTEKELRIWRAIDVCGRAHIRTQEVQLNSNATPIIDWNHQVLGNVPSGSTVQLHCFDQSDLEAKIDRGFSEENLQSLPGCELNIQLERTPIEVEACILSGILEKEKLTWTATDDCGNTNTHEIIVEWIDEDPPVFISPTVDLLIGCGEVPAPQPPEIYENCSNVDLSFAESRAFSQGGELITRVWTATDNCGNQAEQINTISVIDATSLSCNILQEADAICNSSGNALSVQVNGGIEPYSYQWEVTGGVCEIESGANSPNIIYHIGFSPANIRVTITDATGCQVECSVNINCIIDPKDRSEIELDENELVIGRITPNPTDGVLFVQYYAANQIPTTIKIIDAYGTIVEQVNANLTWDERELELNIARLPAGLYYIVFSAPNNEIQSRKIIKY